MKNINLIKIILLIVTIGYNTELYAQCFETLGSASNTISTASSRANQIIVNNDLNTLIFVHRNDISLFGGDNGNFKYDISTDNGNTWLLNQGNLNPNSTIGVNGGRYPQIGLYNPSGNTSLSNATLVYHGPTVGTTFRGYVSGAQLLNGIATPTESYNQIPDTNTLIPGGFCQSTPGKFWTVDAITPDAGITNIGIRLLKGIYSAGDVTWTVDTVLTPDFNIDITGNPYLANWNMAFDPTGMKGWIVLLTHLNGLPDYNYHPVFYNTTDGGDTWNGPIQLDLTSFSSITSVEPNPGCAFESGITVDINGNPHALIGVFQSSIFGAYSINPTHPGHLFDFTYNGSSWNANNVAQTTYENYYINDVGTNANRPIISRSDDGNKIVFTWVESSMPQPDNFPNLKAVTYDVPTGVISCPVIYSLKCPSVLDNQMYQTTVSPNMIENAGIYTVPVVVTIINASGSGLDPAQFYYLNDLSFTALDFTSPNYANSPTLTPDHPGPYCYPDPVVLSANANSHYLWNTGETTQTITVTNGGNYWVVNPDSNFCIRSTNSFTLEYISPPYLYAAGPTYLCNGATVDLFVYYYTAGNSFFWSTGETTSSITVNAPGNYTVAVDGCTSNTLVVLGTDNPYRPSITVEGNSTVCYPATVTLTANANTSYLWSTGETTQSITVYYSADYWLVNPDSNYCVDNNNTVTVSIIYPPYIYTSGSTILCNGSNIDLGAGYYSAGNSVLWSTGQTIQTINVSTTGNYVVTVDGCASDPLQIIAATPPANDNLCNAKSLTIGTVTAFRNYCATVESGEPVPPLVPFTPGLQNGWFDEYFNSGGPVLNNTVWFSFIAPNSKAVNISCSFNKYPHDTQLALYSSSNYKCSGTLTMVAANDDKDYNDYSSFINKAYCLKEGKRYFIQVDGFQGAQDSGTIQVVAVPNITTPPKPDPINNLTGTSYGYCAGGYYVFATNAANADSYNWKVTDGIIVNGQGSNTVTVQLNNPYTNCEIIVKASNCKGVSPERKLELKSKLPAPNISGPSSACNNMSPIKTFTATTVDYASSFIWSSSTSSVKFSDGGVPSNPLTTFSNVVTVDFTGVKNGNRNIRVIASNTCGNSPQATKNVNVSKCHRLSDEESTSDENNLMVYPVPTQDWLTVSFNSTTKGKYNVDITDMTGRIVFSEFYTAEEGENEYRCNIQKITPGVYFLTMQQGDNILRTRIIKD